MLPRVIGAKITIFLGLSAFLLGCSLLSQSPASQSNAEVTRPATEPLFPTVEMPTLPTQASPQEPAVVEHSPKSLPDSLIQPEDLRYLGVFRLPDDQPFEIGWAWSGEALAFRPDGDPNGPDDGFPGSLFGTGHNWNQYVSEIDIPVPVRSADKDINALNTATTLQPFQDIRESLFDHLDFEVPRAGLVYAPAQEGQSVGTLHFCWGQHYQEEGPQTSHGWSRPDLSDPLPVGAWSIGDFNIYSTNDYLFSVSKSWSAAFTPGMFLATGRFRDGGWGGQGPSLIAYDPGDPSSRMSPGGRLPAVPLLMYTSSRDDEFLDPGLTVNDYHHSDEWSGGAWLEIGGRSAVIFAGTKGIGDFWYGFANGVVWPDEPPYPDVPDPPNDDRGWWSTSFEGQIIFYDPDDLADVARGEMAPYEPQPYAALNVDPYLFNIQSGRQKHHLGAAAFDIEKGYLYVIEPLVDDDKPLVHVWLLVS
jgi:hypothetical protein